MRVLQVFLGLISILYAAVIVVSVSGLMIGVVSASIVQHSDQQFRTKVTLVLGSIATLPLACVVAIGGSWSLFFLRRYWLALLPLLLPFASIAIISYFAGKDFSGVMGWN